MRLGTNCSFNLPDLPQETFSYTLEVLADLTRFKESSEPQGKKGYCCPLYSKSLNHRSRAD